MLLIVRHAIAEDKDRFARTGQHDSLRPLTDDGRAKMRDVAAGLRVIVPEIALLATSPFTRAAETAAIIVEEYAGIEAVELEALEPDATRASFLAWLESLDDLDGDALPVAVVGHEPHLSELAGWLITSTDRPVLSLKKGGACLIEFEEAPRAGGGRLAWLLTPSQLRLIGRS